MDRPAAPARVSRAPRSLAILSVLAAFAGLLPVAGAATFHVTNTLDDLPAPPGSLRAAIEASEGNGSPDQIVFDVAGTIDLVAPLPDLLEGGLSIGNRKPTLVPPASNPIEIRGTNGAPRAIAIRSSDNLVTGLDFADFGGHEVILIAGMGANRNMISGCRFGGDIFGSNAGAAIRILGGVDPSFPTGTRLETSRFVRNGAGVVIESSVPPGTTVDSWTRIANCWFGTDPLGAAGFGNGEAIRASGGGRVVIDDNRFSGPGLGISLGAGSAGSSVTGNEIGLLSDTADACSGFAGPALRVEDASSAVVRDNRIRCSQNGVVLALGADKAQLHDNTIGGPSPAGHASDGVVVGASGPVLLRRNAVFGNGGFGVVVDPGPSSDPPDALLACNAVSGNVAGAIGYLGFPPVPPTITGAEVVAVQGSIAANVAGWVEVFGDDLDEAAVFQGAVRTLDGDAGFRHRLPVLGVALANGAAGTVISFDRRFPANHTATVSDESLHRTSSLSSPVAAATSGLVYDMIRGDVANLAFMAGGIDLGPVTCLAAGMDPDPTVTPDVVDPDVPPIGSAFFYVVRRWDTDANLAGTYDPAMCLIDVDKFAGPRIPSSGDCP